MKRIRFWQSSVKRCPHCSTPLTIPGRPFHIGVPLGAFFVAAILVEIPLHILRGGAWPLLAILAGVIAFVIAWWLSWGLFGDVEQAPDGNDRNS